MTEYGPLPLKSQVDVPAGLWDQPLAWAISLVVGVALLALAWRLRGRVSLASVIGAFGATILLTCPLLGMLPVAVYGDYPTIDKQGSILFYLDGVHLRALLHPLAPDAAARLIGVHMGHLWVAQLFDVFLEPFAAFNAEGLLWLALGWACTTAFLRAAGAEPWVSFILGLPFGLGLHGFRDLNWYTIEKTATFGIPLYGLVVLRSIQRGGWWNAAVAAVVLVTGWLNLYFGLLLLFVGSWTALVWIVHPEGRGSWRNLLVMVAATALGLAPLALGQALLMRGGTFASPECFLWGRAALDTVTLWPPRWNRLELWSACHPAAIGLGLWSLGSFRDRRIQVLLAIGAPFALLSLGPQVLGVPNPAYWLGWWAIPFFWRIAKPEMFFFVPYLCCIAAGALRWSDRRPEAWERFAGSILIVSIWFAAVRSHPTYPSFATWLPARLSPHAAEDRLNRAPSCEELRR